MWQLMWAKRSLSLTCLISKLRIACKNSLVIIFTKPGEVTQSCGVMMEPVTRRQKLLPESVKMSLKEVLKGWDASSLMQTSTESWVIHGSSSGDQGAGAFQHLLMDLSTHALHVVRLETQWFCFTQFVKKKKILSFFFFLAVLILIV